jgi:hypothetical protein
MRPLEPRDWPWPVKLRSLARRIAGRRRLEKVMTTRRPMRSLEEFCQYLIERGLTPGTVIDVGAAWGTQEILQPFPQAYHILIDPVPAYEARMKQLLGKCAERSFPTAASSSAASRRSPTGRPPKNT